MRVGCLLVAELPWVAELRADPGLREQAVAVASEPGPRARVLCVSPQAARMGVRPGSSLAQARALCGALRVRVRSPCLERSARQALRDVALSASPRVEPAPPAAGLRCGEACIFLDATGVSSLFGSEAGWATALVTRAQRMELPAVAAVATSRALAQILARRLVREAGAGSVRVLEPSEERAFLDPLPVDLLEIDDTLAETLTRLGIHRLGPLLELPRSTLATRLGPAARQLVARLLGLEPEPPLPPVPETRVVEEQELEAPVDRLEPLAFVLQGVLSRLLERLALRHLACQELHLSLGLEGGGHDERSLQLAAPTRDLRTWLRRVRAALESAPPVAPVESLCVATQGCAPGRDQLDLFRPAGPDPIELDALIAELEILCGPGRVGAPGVADSHRPDAFTLGSFGLVRDAAPASESGETTAVPLALRALRPPLPARVRTQGDRPVTLESALAKGDVVRCAGPWRSSGAWWSSEERFDFDHFDVLTSDGLVVRLRFDRLRRRWELDGVYD